MAILPVGDKNTRIGGKGATARCLQDSSQPEQLHDTKPYLQTLTFIPDEKELTRITVQYRTILKGSKTSREAEAGTQPKQRRGTTRGTTRRPHPTGSPAPDRQGFHADHAES